MLALGDADLVRAGRTFDSDALADQLEGRRKKRRYAYLAWLCLGSHHLYLGRPAVQALFWLTAGGLLLWWLADLFRIPALVERSNRRTLSALLDAWQHQFDRPVERRIEPVPMARSWAPHPVEPPESAVRSPADLDPPADPPGPATGRWSLNRPAITLLLVLAMSVALLYVAAERPVYPRAVLEPSYRTARQINVRASPSTNSAIRAVVGKNILLRGKVEEVTTRGPSTWLRITRGPHEGRYVAVQNLERR